MASGSRRGASLLFPASVSKKKKKKKTDVTRPHPEVRLSQNTTGALTLGRLENVLAVAWVCLSKDYYRGHEQNALGSPYVLPGPDADDRVGGSWAQVAGDKS